MTGSLADALAALADGRIVLLSGDRLRGGDVDLVAAASLVDTATINFMAKHGRGLVCLALPPNKALQLGIGLVNPGTDRQTGRPFGVSIEAREGVTTGISAQDRARTIRVAVADGSSADDIVSPGHVFPLIASAGGVAERHSATEGSLALCRMAGLPEAAVLCAVLRPDGTTARIEDLRDFVEAHGIASVDLADVIAALPSPTA